mgnify:CR=1 FL=1
MCASTAPLQTSLKHIFCEKNALHIPKLYMQTLTAYLDLQELMISPIIFEEILWKYSCNQSHSHLNNYQ